MIHPVAKRTVDPRNELRIISKILKQDKPYGITVERSLVQSAALLVLTRKREEIVHA